jgi:hypothetical protein
MKVRFKNEQGQISKEYDLKEELNEWDEGHFVYSLAKEGFKISECEWILSDNN